MATKQHWLHHQKLEYPDDESSSILIAIEGPTAIEGPDSLLGLVQNSYTACTTSRPVLFGKPHHRCVITLFNLNLRHDEVVLLNSRRDDPKVRSAEIRLFEAWRIREVQLRTRPTVSPRPWRHMHVRRFGVLNVPSTSACLAGDLRA